MAREESTQKIGAGHASAMFRQGLAELRGALYPESNVAPDEQPSILEERLKQAEQQRDADKGREPEPPQQERD
ncbi:MAG: hypothetical protein HUU27_09415 [Phycisphaerae bacterium]|nr:hypothetical protein [Phycisphaerae bacterium]